MPMMQSLLGTEIYLPDAPENARDFLSPQLDPPGRAALTLQLPPTESQSQHPLERRTPFSASKWSLRSGNRPTRRRYRFAFSYNGSTRCE